MVRTCRRRRGKRRSYAPRPAFTTRSATCSCRLDNSSPAHRAMQESVCAAWRQNVRLLLGKYSDEQCGDTFEQLTRAANAIGVTIERRGVFPKESAESAQLVEAAAHECLTNLVRHAGGTRLGNHRRENRIRLARSLSQRRQRTVRPHRRGQRSDCAARTNGVRGRLNGYCVYATL